MITRDALSRLALPLLGAAAVTAGAVLFQMGRKPSPQPETSRSLERSPAEPTFHPGDGRAEPRASVAYDPPDDDTSLLRRLRERGL